jgi:glycosyltransferase involved in cell wall biosynthesis
MMIAIDARSAAETKAGRGRVVRELIEGLAELPGDHRFLLIARSPAPELALDERFEWSCPKLPNGAWQLFVALRTTRPCEVFLSTSSYLTAWFTNVPTVLCVFDLIPFIFPDKLPRGAMLERVTLSRALRRAQAAICISQAAERDLLERFPHASGKTRVVHPGVSPHVAKKLGAGELESVRRRFGLDGEFVLSTGTLEPRKNLVRLIDAFARLPADLRERYRLVLVGASGWQTDEIVRSTRLHSEEVRLLGFVPDDDLAALYQLCTVFCYPSLYEGFGLPLLEAMQAGAPSITSNVSSLPEVGGDAARYVDPLDVDDIRGALEELLGSERKRGDLGERAIELARGFSRRAFAEATLGVLIESAQAWPRQ